MYKKLSKKYPTPKAVDPLLMLPMELAEMVLSYLSFNTIMLVLLYVYLAGFLNLTTELSSASRSNGGSFWSQCRSFGGI
jgi:hypothetical protein